MRKLLYAPVSLKSAQDLVRYFLFLLKTEYRPHPTKTHSKTTVFAERDTIMKYMRSESEVNVLCMYVRVSMLYVARHAQACTSTLL